MPTPQEMQKMAEHMLDAINNHRYDQLDDIMAPDFADHHPGIGEGISSLQNYKDALAYCHKTLALRAELQVYFSQGDTMVTRCILKGKHIGDFMGIPATGKEVLWSTIEFYKVVNGRIKERYAIDDMPGLLSQIGAVLPI